MTEPNSQSDPQPVTSDAPKEPGHSTSRPDAMPETQLTPRQPDGGERPPLRRVGPYELLEPLGRGGFGEVWLAERVSSLVRSQRRWAVKMPHDPNVDIGTVRREAAVWADAGDHPNVLPIVEADVYDGQVVLVSDYVAGGSLSAWLAGRMGSAPPVGRAVDLVAGILAGLSHLHAREIVHRDIKPANILLAADGTPKITDFGLARLLTTEHSVRAPAGTPAYMAPEAFDGERSVQTDLWSVGVMLYQLLSGKQPFPAKDWASALKAVLTREPDPLPADVPPELRAVAERALRKRAGERFASAAEMRAALLGLDRPPAPPAAPQPLAVASIGLHLIPIPAGEFLMGSADDDPCGYLEERPRHRVVIPRPFLLGAVPVTLKQFEAVCGFNPTRFKNPRCPVESVTWFQAIEFCNAFSASEGLEPYYDVKDTGEVFLKGGPGSGYRLPTEAEWEYACRAGSTGQRWFAVEELDQFAWYRANSEGRTHSVGRKRANPWGLRDMLGNVWEWCWDRYLETYYVESPEVGPVGPRVGRERVLRGGSFGDSRGVLRSANRYALDPTRKQDNAGFRIARDVG